LEFFGQGHLPETNLMEWKLDRFDCGSLQRFNTAQLQVVVNDQLSRIEGICFVSCYCYHQSSLQYWFLVYYGKDMWVQ